MTVPLGRIVHLDDDRWVFVGQDDDSEIFFIGFRNGEKETKFTLSPEAFDALVWLRDNWNTALKETFPVAKPRAIWRLVSEDH